MSVRELFAWPQGLPILLLAPLAWGVLRWLDRARAGRLARAAGARARAVAADLSERQRRTCRRLAVSALFLGLVAMLQPLWGRGIRRIEQRGIDILVCLDVSRSMLARDLPPTRLERAKREIRALAGRARGDRIGLVVFAGEARPAVPLTQDTSTFTYLVDQVDPLSVARGGTDLGAALETALASLAGSSGEHEVVLLLTDGDDPGERGLRVARECGKRGVTVHCVGFGSPRGSKIALEGEEGESFLRDASGREVVSAMDPELLGAIARATGGEFVDAAIRPLPLVRLYDKRILPMARKALAIAGRGARTNRYQWPLLAAFALWIMELCLTDRKRRCGSC